VSTIAACFDEIVRAESRFLAFPALTVQTLTEELEGEREHE
jgi:hypothetical protein